uniref:cytochrome b/b6 domain-containing protein n=1 Tax=Polymorphobacter sp. TaxID=1909290 RepID=UPI003F70A957
MQPMKQLRLWHVVTAVLATATYLTDDLEPIHQLLGYTVVALIVVRLLMALLGARPLGLQRYYPQFRDLKLGTIATHPAISRVLLLGIGLCLVGVATTGVLMDGGTTLQAVPAAVSGLAVPVTGGDAAVIAGAGGRHRDGDRHGEDEEGLVGE